MFRFFAIVCNIVITSFFFFPFSFTFFPIANTKMVLALLGLILLLLKSGLKKTGQIDKDFMILSLLAIGVSFASLVSMIVNNTPDGIYLSYIISMWVWLGAGYFVVNVIKWSHKYVSVELVSFYLIAVCVCQCFLAIAIDTIPSIKGFVDSFLSGEGFMGKNEKRLYGVGCALDVAGGRFASLLIIISCLLVDNKLINNKKAYLSLWVSYVVIAVIGNMIGRTTSVGMIISLIYLICYSIINGKSEGNNIMRGLLCTVCCSGLFFMVLYNANDMWRNNLRFGFEGFFSLMEKGRWEVHSMDMLSEGFVFPDNTKTWIFGDGYMNNPENDPYYIGESSWGFYKNTDVGYSRFLFYFGLLGLSLFSIFIMKAGQICLRRFESKGTMFVLLIILNFIIWLKASTDLFLVFALFLCIPKEDNDHFEMTSIES